MKKCFTAHHDKHKEGDIDGGAEQKKEKAILLTMTCLHKEMGMVMHTDKNKTAILLILTYMQWDMGMITRDNKKEECSTVHLDTHA